MSIARIILAIATDSPDADRGLRSLDSHEISYADCVAIFDGANDAAAWSVADAWLASLGGDK